MMRLLIVLAALAALAGCGTQPMRDFEALFKPNKGEAALSVGLKQYEEGKYGDSMKSLQSAISQGLSDGDRVRAHKHLAFIHCAQNRERPCRDEFRRALRVDPSMELAPAEAGHPIWGPVFRSVKAGR